MAGSYGKSKKKKKSKPVREIQELKVHVLKDKKRTVDQDQSITEVFEYYCEFVFNGYGFKPSGESVKAPLDYCSSTGFYIGGSDQSMKLAEAADVEVEDLWFRAILYPNDRHLGYGLAHNWLGSHFLETCSVATKTAINVFWALLWTFSPCMPFHPKLTGGLYANRTNQMLGVLHCAFNTEVERRIALMKIRLPTELLSQVCDLEVNERVESFKRLEPLPMTDMTQPIFHRNKPIPEAIKLDQAKIDALLEELGSTAITPDLSPPHSEGFETASDGQFSFHSACEINSDQDTFLSPPSSPERLLSYSGSTSDLGDDDVPQVIDKEWWVQADDGTMTKLSLKYEKIKASDMSLGARTERNGKRKSKLKYVGVNTLQNGFNFSLDRKCKCTTTKCRECQEIEELIRLVLDRNIRTCTRLMMDLQLYYIHATALIDAIDPSLTRCQICLAQSIQDCPFLNDSYETMGIALHDAIFKSSRIVFFANVVRNYQYLDNALDDEIWCNPATTQMRQLVTLECQMEPLRVRLFAILTFEDVLQKCTEWFLKLQIFLTTPSKQGRSSEVRPLTSLVVNSEMVLLLIIGFTNRLGFLGVLVNDNSPPLWPVKLIPKYEALDVLGSFGEAAAELYRNAQTIDALGEKLTALEVIYNLHRLNPDGSSLEMFLDYQAAYARRRTLCSLFFDIIEYYQRYVDYQYHYLSAKNHAQPDSEECEVDEWLYHFATYWNHRFWVESRKLIRSVPRLKLIIENVEKRENPFVCPVSEKFLELVSHCMFCGKCMSRAPKTCGKCSIARCCSSECWDLVQEVHNLICDKTPEVVLEKFSNLSPYDFSDAMQEIYRHENPRKYH